MLAEPHLKYAQREAVPRYMLLRDGVPTAVLNGHARFLADRFETNLDVGHLLRRERRLAPGERKALAGRPGGDAANLEHASVRQRCDETPAFTRLEAQFTVAARRELEKFVRAPPGADLLREDVERFDRRCFHAQRDNDGAHFRLRSICALNEES